MLSENSIFLNLLNALLLLAFAVGLASVSLTSLPFSLIKISEMA